MFDFSVGVFYLLIRSELPVFFDVGVRSEKLNNQSLWYFVK